MTRFEAGRPGAGAAFYKGHGLGNDYLVVEEGDAWTMDEASIRDVCHRREGVGGDGIVVLLLPAEEPFRLRMFNPDGSEFERSGNGLRVLASWLHRTGRVATGRPFEVEVGGDRIVMTVHGRRTDGPWDVSVEMGRAETGPGAVGLREGALEEAGDSRVHGLLRLPGDERASADRGAVPVNLVGVGNPHCVVFLNDDAPTRDVLDRIGPALAAHPAFTRGTNMQLARVAPPGRGGGGGRAAPVLAGTGGAADDATAARDDSGGGLVDALIWERGVGHTSASGTSACAVAVAAVESGRLSPGRVEVRMEGGVLIVDVGGELDVVLRGPVEEAMTGEIAPGLLGRLASGR